MEQEVVPGSKVQSKFVDILNKGETASTRVVNKETAQLTFVAIVPMGNNNNAIKNALMLETEASNYNMVLNKMYLYMIFGGMIMLVIVIFTSVQLAMNISKPISRLATTIGEVSRGSHSLHINNQPLDEINLLTDQVNRLTERLQKVEAESYKMQDEKPGFLPKFLMNYVLH